MRYCLQLAYDGTRYHGWQIQPNAHTVQAELNKALSTLLGQDVETLGCGRTDTGVHAREFFAHFDMAKEVPDNLVYKLNRLLPHDIAIYDCRQVADDFHARFDATLRKYEYYISRRKDPFTRDKAWQYMAHLDIAAMQEGAALLKTFTDFEAFSKAHTDVFTNNCTIYESRWEQREHMLVYHVSANRFLRNMVRAMVGTLVDMGKGSLDIAGLKDIVASKNRSEAGTSVPACGLYLVKVEY